MEIEDFLGPPKAYELKPSRTLTLEEVTELLTKIGIRTLDLSQFSASLRSQFVPWQPPTPPDFIVLPPKQGN